LETIYVIFFNLQAAVSRIERLSDATEEQLKVHADVCAICYGDMQVRFESISSFLGRFQSFARIANVLPQGP
jgi:hypothetical protein